MNIQISSIRNKISIQLKPKVESKIYFKHLLSTPIESIFNLALSFLMHKVESICRDHFNTQTHFCHLSLATHFPKSFFPELFMLCWGKGVTDFTLWFFFVLLIWRWFKCATDYSRIIIMHTTAKGRSVEPHSFPSGHAIQRLLLLWRVKAHLFLFLCSSLSLSIPPPYVWKFPTRSLFIFYK